MNYKAIGKTILLVAGGAVVNYLITLIPSVHFSATLDPVITGVATIGLHALEQWIVGQNAVTPQV